MNVYKSDAQFAHGVQGNGCVVDECSTFSVYIQFASDDTVCFFKFDVVLLEEVMQMESLQIEMSFDNAFLFALHDVSQFGAVAQQQPDGSKNDAFSCSCFAGNDRETGVEIDVEFFNESEVFDIEMCEHGYSLIFSQELFWLALMENSNS